MMEQMARGGGMPGHARHARDAGLGGGKRAGARQQPAAKGKKGKKRVSGNPAKAAQQQAAEKAAAARRPPTRSATPTAPRSTTRRPPSSSTCPRTSRSSSSESTLVVDGANVVGSVPDGWWKDRAGAARRLHERLLVGDTSYDVIVLVLEGRPRAACGPGGTRTSRPCTRRRTATPRSRAGRAGRRGRAPASSW